MDQIMTWVLKLIRYWLDLEQVHHSTYKLIQNRPLIFRKHMHLFAMSRDFGFQDRTDSIYIILNVLDALFIYLQKRFHIIFTFVFPLNDIYIIFQKVFHCADVVYIPHGIYRPISFFSNLFHPCFNFEPLFMVHSPKVRR